MFFIICYILHIYFVVVMTSVGETKSSSELAVHSQTSQASLNIPASTYTFGSNAVNSSVTSVSTVSSTTASGTLQSLSSCYVGPSTTSSSEKHSSGPPHMHYGSVSTSVYNPLIVQPPRMMDHPNAPCYHPSTDFQARMSLSYRQMVTFASHQGPSVTSGYAVYDRHPVHAAGSSWSGNMQLSRQAGSMYGLPPPVVSNTAEHQPVELPPALSDVQEPVRAPVSTKSKKRSRAQQKESYSSILDRSVPCPNIDVRQIIQEQRERLQKEAASCSAAGMHPSTGMWTMLTASASTSQQVVARTMQNLSTPSAPFISSMNSGVTTASSSFVLAASEFGSRLVDMTANVSVSSMQMSTADCNVSANSFRVVSSASVSPALSCDGSLPYIAASTTRRIVSNHSHITAPMSASLSCTASWIYTRPQQLGQYYQWSPYSSHPMSCTPVSKSSFGMNPHQSQFDCSQGQQVPGVQPSLNDVLAPALSSVEASSGWLPAGEVVPNSASETAKDESPIRLVQNMVSGLETTQNSLAMATSLIFSQADSVPRRRRSGAADAVVTATATMLANSEQCDDVVFNSDSPNVGGQTNSSLCLLDEDRCTQAKPQLPTTSSATTVTSVLTQVLPAASVVPSAYCIHPLPLPSVQPSVISSSSAVRLSSSMSHAVSVAASSSTSAVESIATSDADAVDGESTCHSGNTALSTSVSDVNTAQLFSDSQVVDDDESTQDCDVSIAGTDLGDVLCTTGTQTSTPASVMSNCNSVESGGDGSESNDAGEPMISAPDEAAAADLQPDTVTAPKPSAACDEKTPADVHPEQIPVPTSTPVVLIPRVPQASFLLPQNIAFTPNPLVGHGFLQFQPPGEFGYGTAVHSSGANAVGQPGALGLVHFAAGPMVGPAVGNMMTASDASGSFRLMTPVKSDSDAYRAAECLPLMPAAMPAGHILLQNIVPTGLASTIVPLVQPAALCNLPGGSSALFAMSQGSVMSVGAPLAFASVPLPGQHHQLHDHAPDQPDSTVDNSEMDTTDERSSDDSADTEQVTSTDEPLDEVSDNPSNSATSIACTIVSTHHCGTGHTAHSPPTNTIQCNTPECGSNTSSRTEYDLSHNDEVAAGPCASHSTAVQQSWSLMPALKKNAQLGRSRLKKMRRGYGCFTLPSTTDDQIFCSSSQSNLSAPTSITMLAATQDGDGHCADALTSQAESKKFTNLSYIGLETTDVAASDSSVSTTISLHDGSNDGMDTSRIKKSGHQAGSVEKARWKKKALARQTKIRLRHSKREAKQLVDTQFSPSETSHVGKY